MAAAAVAFDGTRVNPADTYASPPWYASTATPSAETDFIYQNTASISAQVKTTENGFYYYNSGVTHNFTIPQVWIAKTWVTNYGVLTTPGLVLEIGTGTRTAYHRYIIYTNATYPIAGGWLITPIDPNLAGYRSSSTGTPNLAAVNYYGIRAAFTVQSKVANLGIDAIDIIPAGSGLTLTDGTGGGTNDGTFQSFITADEGTSGNRWGIVLTKEGILYVTGTLTIGSATATVFTDSNQTVVFPSGRFGTGFCGIKVSLANASTVVTMTSITFTGRGQYGNDGATADSRPNFTVTGTSGALTLDSCAFNKFNAMTFTSTVTSTDSTFNLCQSLTQASATLTGCTFNKSPVTTGNSFLSSDNPELISNCSFISSGTGYAIVITAAGTYTFTGNTFSGYATNAGTAGNRAIYNNSSGLVTLNITGGGDTPSYTNGAGATTVINNNITLTVTVQDSGTNPIVGAQVAVYKTSDNSTILASTATNGSGIVSTAVAASTGAIYIRVRQSNTGDSTRYYPNSAVGSIGTTDFSTTITMTEDVAVV